MGAELEQTDGGPLGLHREQGPGPRRAEENGSSGSQEEGEGHGRW